MFDFHCNLVPQLQPQILQLTFGNGQQSLIHNLGDNHFTHLDYAITSFTTRPYTSVNLKSRPP